MFMAPPTVVLDRTELSIPDDCPLKKLTQYDCKLADNDQSVLCIPIVRHFRACPKGSRVQLFEVTDPQKTNDALNIREITHHVLSLAPELAREN